LRSTPSRRSSAKPTASWGAATYFAIAASFFTEVRIVAVVGEDFGANVQKVFGGGRSISRASKGSGETFRWKGEYGFDLKSVIRSPRT
jgi:hypothetical protein